MHECLSSNSSAYIPPSVLQLIKHFVGSGDQDTTAKIVTVYQILKRHILNQPATRPKALPVLFQHDWDSDFDSDSMTCGLYFEWKVKRALDKLSCRDFAWMMGDVT